MEKNRAKITVKFGQAERTTNALVNPVPKKALGPEQPKNKLSPIKPVLENNHLAPADEEIAASFNHVDENEVFGPKYVPDDIPKKRETNARRRYKKGLSRGKVAAVAGSVIGAVTVGLIFGSIALSFFKTGGAGKIPSNSHVSTAIHKETGLNPAPNSAAQGQDPATAATGKTDVTKAATSTATKSPITMPASTYYVVQAGVFQEQGNASPMVDKIKAKGWPNMFIGEKPLYLLLGLAVNRDHALSLASQYKDVSVFIKEFKEEAKTVSVPIKEGVRTSQEEWDQWFEKESEFVKTIGQAIGQGLNTGKFSEDMFQNVTTAHQNLLQKGRDIVGKLPDENQDQGNRLLNDYTKIVTAMEHYQKQPGEGFLWQAEQGLLDAYQSKKQLFSTFK